MKLITYLNRIDKLQHAVLVFVSKKLAEKIHIELNIVDKVAFM